MNIDIAAVLRQSLLHSGVNEKLLEDFDSHSTISLEFEDDISICIDVIDEDVWIWNCVADESTNLVSQRGALLLEKLMHGCAFTRGGQLMLSTQDGEIVLKGMIHPEFLQSPERFIEALNEFYASVKDMRKSLQ